MHIENLRILFEARHGELTDPFELVRVILVEDPEVRGDCRFYTKQRMTCGGEGDDGEPLYAEIIHDEHLNRAEAIDSFETLVHNVEAFLGLDHDDPTEFWDTVYRVPESSDQ